MRDIRQDLRERLASVRAKRASLERAIDALSAQEASINKLLEEEEAMWDEVNPGLFAGAGERPQGTPLSQVLLETLRTKSGTASLEELKEAAVRCGVPFGGKQPGRVIHFAMLGMQQHKLVDRKTDGRWTLVEHAVN